MKKPATHQHDPSHNALQSGGTADMVDLSYSVIAVHHMKVLYGSALQVSWEMAANTKLCFSPMGKQCLGNIRFVVLKCIYV